MSETLRNGSVLKAEISQKIGGYRLLLRGLKVIFFFRIRNHSIIDSLPNSETEKYREKEREAAITIQKIWRMLKVKWHYHTILKSCRLVQRIWRGHFKGRMRFFRKQEEDKRSKQLAFFHEMAKIIQK